jgi:hypothetical protein
MRRPVGVKGIVCSKYVFRTFSVTKLFLPPSSRCRHASIRTLEERILSLGACWAFSFQPVLPSVWRPLVSLKSGTRARRLTQSPELGFGFCLFSSGNDFDFALPFCFTQLSQQPLGCCCAMARTPLRSPTGDATALPAFLPWQRSPASCRFFHHAPPVSAPSVADHSRSRMVPECAALPAPAAFADTDRPLC